MKTVSILMPCYNAGQFIEPTVSQALTELAAHDELIIQDGGSTDGSADLLRRLAAGDQRIRLESKHDSGQSEALNRAAARATGDYFGWLNADDFLYSGAIAKVRHAASTNPDVILGGYDICRSNGERIRDYRTMKLTTQRLVSRGCYAFSGATFIRRGLWNALHGVDTDFQYCMDYDLFIRMASQRPSQVVIDDVIAGLRLHRASKSGSAPWRFVVEGAKLRARYVRQVGLRSVVRGVSVDALAVMTGPLRRGRLYSALRRTKTWAA